MIDNLLVTDLLTSATGNGETCKLSHFKQHFSLSAKHSTSAW